MTASAFVPNHFKQLRLPGDDIDEGVGINVVVFVTIEGPILMPVTVTVKG
jgi:hypothetical protein